MRRRRRQGYTTGHSYAVRQDIRNLDKHIRQMEFLLRHNMDTLEQLQAYRLTQEQAVANLLAERRQLHSTKPDAAKARLEQIAQQLKLLRRDIRLCHQIAEHSVGMRECLNRRTEKKAEPHKNTEREMNRETTPTR